VVEYEQRCQALEAELAAAQAAREAGARVVARAAQGRASLEKVPPPPRTKWTRRVPHPVLIGHAASLTPY
jgi:hypothetical protein